MLVITADRPVGAQQADPPASQADDAPFGDLLEGLDETGEADEETAGDGEAAAASDMATPPLFEAQRAMGEAARLLAENNLSLPTQTAQQQALDALDAFLSQALEASTQPPSTDPQASQQQRGDREANGDAESQEAQSERDEGPAELPGDQSDTASPRPGQAPEETVESVAGPLSEPMEKAVWGHLPERMRERLQATLPEEFLPAYEQAIRDYFTRLSEMSDDEGE